MRGHRSIITAIVPIMAVGIGASGPAAQTAQAAELSAEEIIVRVDANSHIESAHFDATMIIRTDRRELVKEMEIRAEGTNGLVTFVNPADRGTKYLKLDDEMWLYFPDAVDLVKISGHMLNQGMMGSDFSYKDAMESRRLEELYEFTLVGTESCDGATCYVLDAEALPGKEVTYAKRRMWVDDELFVIRRQELRAVSGRLLKVSHAEEVEEIDGHPFVTRITMRNVLRRNSSTTLIMENLELGVEIPEGLFSLRTLMR